MFTGHSNPPSPKREKTEEENIMEVRGFWKCLKVPKTAEKDQVQVFAKVAGLSKEATTSPQAGA
jgi:hypothetical protein